MTQHLSSIPEPMRRVCSDVHESEKLYAVFAAKGVTAAADAASADIIVLNTCCVREGAETRVLGNLGKIKKIKSEDPSVIVAICGCMTQKKETAEAVHKRCPFVDIITGTYKLRSLPDMVSRIEAGERFILDLDVDDAVPDGVNEAVRTENVNRFVNIMYGCDNFCTYCIVPYVKGRERSRRMTDVVNEVRSLLSDGAKEITLLGQNVNSYRDADGHDFYALLSELSGLDGKFWIKFMTSHPKDLSPDVIRLIGRSPVLADYIHLPLQSGSDRILREMNRKYDRAGYLATIDLIREQIPNAGLSSDIIVGFPTETEEDFEQTLDIVRRVRYNNLFMFLYSKRSGTPAAEMDGQIPEEVKKERITRLIGEQKRIASELAKECVGKTYKVLCDSRGSMVTGKTQEDRVIVFDSEGSDLYNEWVTVEVTGTKNSKLYGKMIRK